MTVQIVVEERSQIAQARREAVALARRLSIDDAVADRLGLVVTETATNLIKDGAGTLSMGGTAYSLRTGSTPRFASMPSCRLCAIRRAFSSNSVAPASEQMSRAVCSNSVSQRAK